MLLIKNLENTEKYKEENEKNHQYFHDLKMAILSIQILFVIFNAYSNTQIWTFWHG